MRKSAAILNDVKYSICSSLDFDYRLWAIIFTQEGAPDKHLPIQSQQ